MLPTQAAELRPAAPPPSLSPLHQAKADRDNSGESAAATATMSSRRRHVRRLAWPPRAVSPSHGTYLQVGRMREPLPRRLLRRPLSLAALHTAVRRPPVDGAGARLTGPRSSRRPLSLGSQRASGGWSTTASWLPGAPSNQPLVMPDAGGPANLLIANARRASLRRQLRRYLRRRNEAR